MPDPEPPADTTAPAASEKDARAGVGLDVAIGVACALALTLWVFAGLIFGGEQLAYRDTAFFYRPLVEYIQMEWAAGRVPLWNPYDGCGEPLLASGTADQRRTKASRGSAAPSASGVEIGASGVPAADRG